MSQPPVPTPAPEPLPPRPSTIAAITEPWWKRRTTWAAIIVTALALPSYIEPIAPLLPEKWRDAMLGLAATIAAVAAVLARMGGVEAAGVVREEIAATKATADSLRWGRTPGG